MLDFDKVTKKYCIALTGGISTGKSFVASHLREKGFFVLDADEMSREVVKPNSSVLQEIVDHFGKQVLDKNNKLDRKALGKIIFDKEQDRRWVEDLLHPAIWLQTKKRVIEHGLLRSPTLWFYEASLIFERSYEDSFKEVWLTWCSNKTQIIRTAGRSGISQKYAEDLIKNQLSHAEKLARSHFTLNTDMEKKEVLAMVDSRLKKITS
jgi:dephospho-CoA kinase